MLPAFLRPKGMHRNFNISKGAMMAVLQRNFLKVQFGKHLRTFDPRGKISDVGERIAIRNKNGI